MKPYWFLLNQRNDDFLQPISQDFGNDLGYVVYKRDRSIIIHRSGVINVTSHP
jgi:hypothetical protein